MPKLYYTTHEVKDILALGSLRTAQARVKALNAELEKQGYWTERGKVPIAFFHEKYLYIEKLKQE